MRGDLIPFFARSYAGIKAQYPQEGRRKWHLRVVDEFWAAQPVVPLPNPSESEGFDDDDDPFDVVLGETPAVILRTDFSDENAWLEFLTRVNKAREEFKTDNEKPDEHDEENLAAAQPSGQATNSVSTPDGESDSEEEDGGDSELIRIVNPAVADERALFQDISNLTALRLLNDVGIRRSPSPPEGTKRVSPPNRLVDHHGWQEIYSGQTIWVYDSTSNRDGCLRLVSQEGDALYGTATGDSWRAQASHIYELQFNMSFLGMKINFGGMDRWDCSERKRNLKEAEGQ